MYLKKIIIAYLKDESFFTTFNTLIYSAATTPEYENEYWPALCPLRTPLHFVHPCPTKNVQ